jgi:hypothetical protein
MLIHNHYIPPNENLTPRNQKINPGKTTVGLKYKKELWKKLIGLLYLPH